MHPLKQIFRENLKLFFRNLEASGKTGSRRILAAISGGADSVFLLEMLAELSREFNFYPGAATVDHRIRPPEESSSDADFVEKLCVSFSPPVPCFRIILGEGEVYAEAEKRGMGIEEAARFLRYRALYEKAGEWDACALMTGHTASDQIETLLMRFLQGSGFSASGINPEQGILFRPMLSIPGEEVREFLRSQGIHWREDKTNREENFLRNKIRLKLVPALDRDFPGWRKAVLCGLEKTWIDSQALSSFPLPEWKEHKFSCSGDSFFSCSPEEYFSMLPAFRLRFLYKGLSMLGIKKRIPFRLIKNMIYGSRENSVFTGDFRGPDEKKAFRTGFSVRGSGIFFETGKNRIFFGRDIVHNHKNGYLVYVTGAGNICLPSGKIKLVKIPGKEKEVVFEKFPERVMTLPFVIRSRLPDDYVVAGDGNRRSLKKLFNCWGIPGFQRNLVPVVEDCGGIFAVLGSFLGFPDYFSWR